MEKELSGNKRIAKNTFVLYLRLFLVLGVSLYTSRVVLKVLGVSDFGIYNVVGGFVSMLAYLNSACVGASQRFVSFALGKSDLSLIHRTFSTIKQIHIILALIIIFIAETFGLWFINTHLVISPERMAAANWVYQCSLASLFITIISIPYSACIVAHEHMHIYAYVSILDVVLKLVILYLLVVMPFDKLIVYAVMHVIVSFILRVIYTVYCRRHFEECHVKPSLDKPLFKEIFGFAGWTALGSLGFSFKDQFSNIILNGFFGTSINAARGIAMQVNSAVNAFSENFFTAIKPQIVKQYAAGNLEQSQKLVYAGARFSFFLMSIIAIPVIVNIDYILKIWLGVVPDYTSSFLVITLITSLIYSLTTSTSTAIQATGKIRTFQIGITIIMLLELPAAYLILKTGAEPPMALIPMLFTTTISLVYRFIVLKKQVPSYSSKRYFIWTVLRCVIVFIACYVPNYYISNIFPEQFKYFVMSTTISVFLNLSIIYFCGLNNNERRQLNRFILSKVRLK